MFWERLKTGQNLSYNADPMLLTVLGQLSKEMAAYLGGVHKPSAWRQREV